MTFRGAWLPTLLTISVSACARTNPVPPATLTLTVAGDAVPGADIDLIVTIVNQTMEDLLVVEAAVTEGNGVALELTARAPPDVVMPGASASLVFGLRLPSAFTELSLEAEVVLLGAESLDGYRVQTPSATVVTPGEPTVIINETDLLVSTADDELDGGPNVSTVADAGGANDLSLREAIAIANNRMGADTVAFDPDVFPAAGVTEIFIPLASQPLRITDAFTTVTGDGAGAVIRLELSSASQAFGVLAPLVTLQHLTFVDVGDRAIVLDSAGGSVIDQCEFTSDNQVGDPVVSVDVSADVSITNNRWVRGEVAIELLNSNNAVISGNVMDAVAAGVEVISSDSVDISFNTIELMGSGQGIRFYGGMNATVVFNTIINPSTECIILRDTTLNNFVADNILIQCKLEGGILVMESSQGNELRRNLIDPPGGGLITVRVGCNGDIAPPTITDASSTISGNAGPNQEIEVYSGAAGLRAFLGTAATDANGNWALDVVPTGGENLRATATDLVTRNTSEASVPFLAP